MNISLDALAAFKAVATLGSFTRAAKALHVTQGAVSHRVRNLEEQLGYALFIRTTRTVTLTQAGTTIAGGVDRGLAAIEEAFAAVERRRRVHTLSVSCSPSFAIRWLVRNLHHFRELHPKIGIRVAAADDLVGPGEEDIDVCVRFGAGGYPGVSVTRLTTEHVFPVLSPTLLRDQPLSRERALENHVLLHHDVMRDHPEHIPWSRWLSPAARNRVNTSDGLHFSHAHMALEAALAGQGVALGRSTLVAEDLRAGRLVAPLRRRVPSGLSYWFLSTREGKREVRIRAFRDWLRKAIATA